MKIFLTGGNGDLGKVLTYQLEKRGDSTLRFDVKKPHDSLGQFIQGSILDRETLSKNLTDIDCIVHIAAWHGFHEFTQQKNAYDFWDLNVTGTFNVFHAALLNNVKNIIFISSESVVDKNGMYGWTKVLSEQIAQRYFEQHHLNVLTLRPRAFIPYWNHDVYQSFVEWAKWYWKGAVHINDVAKAVIQSIDLLANKSVKEHFILPVDGAYEYTENDLENWDQNASGETFRKYYAKYFDLAIKYGLDPTLKPTKQDISKTKKCLGYTPSYSLKNLLEELTHYGDKGPPINFD
ncbi:MAG: NAD(P)-dependent oxidoreductase [Gammaproteobacteria bacterium]